MISLEEFIKEVESWADEIEVEFKDVQFKAMKNKWGSCSSTKILTFNEELLQAPKDMRDKVIVHELLHLRYPNHGKMFQLLIDAYLQKKQ